VAQCDAEKLPFPDNHFDVVTVAFGLRNMTHKDQAIAEMRRVLKPGGRLLVLEFSKVWKPLAPAYDFYSFKLLPMMGEKVAKDAESYRYLAESIRMHPDQESLKELMEERRPGPRRILQHDRRRRRAAPGLQALAGGPPAGGAGRGVKPLRDTARAACGPSAPARSPARRRPCAG
jgi:SAM-dependent methyltransferase